MIIAERITEKTVRLSDGGKITSVPAEKLADNVKEGDVVVLKNGIYVKDEKNTKNRSSHIRNLFDSLKRRNNK